MVNCHLAKTEMKFAEIIWDNEPITSGELVKICNDRLNWKSTTVYTVLRRLCDRGLFRNEKSVVTSLVSKEEFTSQRSKNFVGEMFNGSLPAFLTAFIGGEKLSAQQAEEIKKLIDTYSEEK